LLYAGHYSEVKSFVAELKPTSTRRALALAAAAAMKGGAAAIQQSADVGGNENDRRTALYNAGIMLMRMRMYLQAVELMTAGTKEQADSAQVLGLIQALSKTTRV